MESMGKRIKKMRKLTELDQKEFGKLFELKYGAVSAWECDKSKPNADEIIKIAEFFNVSTDYLLTGKEESRLLSKPEREVLNLYRTDADVQKEINAVLEEKKNMIFRLHQFFANRRHIPAMPKNNNYLYEQH